MPVVEHMNPMLAAAAITALLSIYYLFSLLFRLKKLRLISAVSRLFSLLIFSALTASLSIIILGTQGYKALTKEEKVARVVIDPVSEQTFHARIIFLDGSEQVFSLNGDEFVIDAYVLKWKSWTNLLGLHTAYRLDRIAGRYQNISDEQNKARSVFAINNKGDKGIGEWREKYAILSFMLDVEHGSASFASADKSQSYELAVTTSGLLLRPEEVEE